MADRMERATQDKRLRNEKSGRAKAEAALAASEEQFRMLIGAVKDYAIFLLDPNGFVATWNPGAERIKGYKAEEIIGRHFSTFYPQDAIDRGWPREELRLAATDGRIEDEGWRLRKDGSRFWANVVITALRDDAGILRGFGLLGRIRTVRRLAMTLWRAGHRMPIRIPFSWHRITEGNNRIQQLRITWRGHPWSPVWPTRIGK